MSALGVVALGDDADAALPVNHHQRRQGVRAVLGGGVLWGSASVGNVMPFWPANAVMAAGWSLELTP